MISFYSFVGTIFTIDTNRMSFPSIGIPLVNCISLCVQIRLGVGSFYSSIGSICTIGTNGISFIPLVFHW